MTDIFSRPISHARLLANTVAAFVLACILAGLLILIFIESAERGRRHGDAPAPYKQSIPFKGDK